MDITYRQTIAAPPALVYQALHDRFTDLPLHIPNLQSIRETQREPMNNGMQKTQHRWKADPDLLPAVARAFVKPSVLEWIGFAEWRHHQLQVHFVFESEVVRGLFDCAGSFAVTDENGTSRLAIDVTFVMHPERVPALPRLLRSRVAGVVETTVLNVVRPSLAAIPNAVAQFLPQGT